MSNRFLRYGLVCCLIILTFNFKIVIGQEESSCSEAIENLAETVPALNTKVDISVSDISLQEFIRAVAYDVSLNLNIDPEVSGTVTNNFSNVSVKDILIFLCNEYPIHINNIANIIQIKPIKEKPVEKRKPSIIEYDSDNDLLSVDIVHDTLRQAIKSIINESKKNIVLSPGLEDHDVNAYIMKMPFDNALEKIAFTNGLKLEKSEDGFYILSKKEEKRPLGEETTEDGKKRKSDDALKKERKKLKIEYAEEISINEDRITAILTDKPIYDIIKFVSDTLDINYIILSSIEGKVDLHVKDVGYESLIDEMLYGTEYTYIYRNGIFIFGSSQNPSLAETIKIKFEKRTVDKILEFLPEEFTQGVSIKEFSETNSLIATGPQPQLKRLRSFIRSVDNVVPLVMIELLIVDLKKNFVIETGIKAGIGEPPELSSQSIFPGVDYELSTRSINQAMNGLNGINWLNLGNVTPDFYLALSALESQGNLDIRSTPKLSTLSGHEATMTNGETRFYKEEKSNFIGTQNPAVSNSFTWKSINADLSITLKPIVSGDNQVTMEIDVQQSEFNPNSGDKDAPPGSFTRSFKSLIRVKDQDMVLLGGLERLEKFNGGQGWPLLSRIPVIKWIFSSREKSKINNKLNIFIKPTIVY